MGVLKITSASQFDSLIKSNKLTLVDFYADWCGPCKAVAPRIEQLSSQHEHIQFLKVNVDENSDISSKYGVSAMPTFIFFQSGVEKAKVVGANMGEITRYINILGSGSGGSAFAGKGNRLGGSSGSAAATPAVSVPNWLKEGDQSSLIMIGIFAFFIFYLYLNKGAY